MVSSFSQNKDRDSQRKPPCANILLFFLFSQHVEISTMIGVAGRTFLYVGGYN